MGKRLYRSRTNKVIAGVCGGIAEYFAIDPTIVRILFIILSLLPGPGIIAYIIAVFIIPERKVDTFASNFEKNEEPRDTTTFDDMAGDWKEPQCYDSKRSGILIGAILIILGIMFFVRQFFSWFDTKYLFPLVLVAIGFVIIFKGRRGSY